MFGSNSTKWILASSFALSAIGFLLPFWPLAVVGILLAALSGRVVFAIAIGLLLDIAYGAPLQTAHMLFFPFAAVAVVGILARVLGKKYILSKDTQDSL